MKVINVKRSLIDFTKLTFWIVDIAKQNLSRCVIAHNWVISQPVGVVPFASFNIDRVQAHVVQNADVERSQVSVFAASRLSKAETLCAAFGVLLLQVVVAISAVVTLSSLNALLTEACLKWINGS